MGKKKTSGKHRKSLEKILNALNKAKLKDQTNLPKSTLYSTLKHRNPTVKTLAKIMYASTH